MAKKIIKDYEINEITNLAWNGETKSLLQQLSALAKKAGVSKVDILLSASHTERTLLYWAVSGDELDTVRAILEVFDECDDDRKNSYINLPCDVMGYTILHHAALRGRIDIIRVLLEHGASMWGESSGNAANGGGFDNSLIPYRAWEIIREAAGEKDPDDVYEETEEEGETPAEATHVKEGAS